MEHPKEELEQQAKADQFWQENFSDYLNIPITEYYALENHLWEKLETALQATADLDTIWSVVFAEPLIQITSADMRTRIAKTAKHIWHSKQLDKNK